MEGSKHTPTHYQVLKTAPGGPISAQLWHVLT